MGANHATLPSSSTTQYLQSLIRPNHFSLSHLTTFTPHRASFLLALFLLSNQASKAMGYLHSFRIILPILLTGSMSIVVDAFHPTWAQQGRESARVRNSKSCLSVSTTEIFNGSSSHRLTARDLRAIKVTNKEGQKVPLGDAISDKGISIVVFLRHLGCTWCWSYVHQWKLLQHEMAEAGIEGPIFVSIGDADRLNAFLSKNPEISSDKFFVDGYDFAAFKEAGFGRFDEKPKSITGKVKAKPAVLGGPKGWWIFLTSFIPLAPVTPDMKFPENLTPEGLFWVGGTFVVAGDDITYRWDDRISGDHPEAIDVLDMAKAEVSARSI